MLKAPIKQSIDNSTINIFEKTRIEIPKSIRNNASENNGRHVPGKLIVDCENMFRFIILMSILQH
jgi:hypothetical protein